MKKPLSVMMTLLFTASCSTVNTNVCPTLYEYSKEAQIKALDELQSYDVPTLRDWLKDYHTVRNQIRICIEH